MALQALQSSGVAFRKILSHFPEELSLAFAYGSGVYRQAGPSSDQKNAMLDFVFTVDDPVAWHSKNLKKNWNHYSFLKVLGPRFITTVQNNYGAGVYYNPLIMCDGRLIKYGIISTSVLIEDLLTWNNLYIAGRLQKPIDKSPEGQFTQLMTLPKTLQQQINHIMDPPGKNRDVEETLLQVAHDPDCGDVVRLGLSAIVRPSSMRQSTKGIFTAGMETPLDVLSRAASLVHADDEKREAALRGEPRLQTLPVASALTSHRTGPPPISPSKRKFTVEPGDDELDCESDHASKMSRIFAPHLNKTANGDCRKDPRERSRSPIERAVAPAASLHGSQLYASLPSLGMEQPLALTKNSLDAGRPAGLSPTLTPVERQQNRPSVITCASASARNCNLSHCPIAHSGCAAGPASYRRAPSSATTCDPVVEEHFRRSLGKNYKEPEPAPNSVSITGSVDDHFAKALGDTWLQIKAAKDGASSSPESASRRGQPASPSAHMVSHSHSPSVAS
ncbi:transcription cofactor vestigial-like protein 4 isoform X4 [Balaenoptera ricei]|uniref:transcription cofactor vestigial-like protein 4 isoform X4 n=1 Tax=Balaenoptera ricei TaxID=2746895 RepID=UPI0028BE2E5E|nr:transcription cofactor vestigial-like protein 4 isoform X4 [Balaenoptera ricei]